jgi:uncharacterized protein (DUF433 family)
MTAPTAEIYPGITADPAVAHGQVIITGTRMPVSVLLEYFAAGDSREQLSEDFGLTTQQIDAALAYAAYVTKGERVYPAPEPGTDTSVA